MEQQTELGLFPNIHEFQGRKREGRRRAHDMTDEEIRHVQAKQTRKPIQDQFERFLKDTPAFWPLFVRFAREAKRAGFKHYGAKAIIERARWEIAIASRTEEPFKINNNYAPRLARKLMLENSDEFSGFFTIRKLERD